MKIKRYLDKDMRHVLRQVREDQGPDAVILSNRRINEGIEVIAAIDYDEALVRHALGDEDATAATLTEHDIEQLLDKEMGDVEPKNEIVSARLEPSKQTPPAAPLVDIVIDDDPQAPAGSTGSELPRAADDSVSMKPDVVAATSVPAVALQNMQNELASLRGLLETQLSGLVWKDSSRRFPQRVQILKNLARIGVAPDIANIVLNRMPPIDDDEIWRTPLITLAQAIPVSKDNLIKDGGVAALIGPSGVGKTTTIAKLASRFAMEHGSEDIALISADSYRIGAKEHLKAFANIIGVAVHSASSSDELQELLVRLSSKKLVLIDTEGRSQRDRDLANRLAAYGQHAERVRFYLTLSAATQEAGLDEAVRMFNKVPLSGCVVTKIDEAAQLGCVLSAAIRHELPVSWLSDGQRIPDDLHLATRKRLWLVNQALECLQASDPKIDERFMAENFAEVSVAHG